jgi:SAM-dependent methyltransferase
MASINIKDDRGYNQGFVLSKSTTVRMERRTDLLLSEMDLTKDTRILEIGCGTGEVSYWMASRSPAQVVGTDLCVPFIEGAKKKYQLPNLRYEVVDFNNPGSFSGEKFDYIVGNGILHHLYYGLDEAFSSMRRLLKENGRITFLEPNFYNPYIYLIFSYPKLRSMAHLEPGEMAFSRRFIREKLARAGFEDIRVDYKDFLLPGIPDFLIAPSIWAGAVLEKIPLIKKVSQSIFIRARNP